MKILLLMVFHLKDKTEKMKRVRTQNESGSREDIDNNGNTGTF